MDLGRNSSEYILLTSSASTDPLPTPKNDDGLPHSTSAETDSRASLELRRRLIQDTLGLGLPRLWNEVLPRARYSGHHFSMELTRSLGIGDPSISATHWRDSFDILPLDGSLFAPYVEKETWMPQAAARAILDKRGINLRIIYQWMTICARLHGDRCKWKQTGDSPEATGPAFLIDVESMNLVRADPVIQYVALSYIWGDSDGVCATSDNIAQIMEKNAFSSPAFNISKVISDAIQLVRHLGGKYLWVDRYCIPQDDNPLKQSQLEAMGSIFAGAWFTIIAAQNDVPIKGLCGTRNIFISAEHSNVAFNSEPETVFEVNGECLTNREVMMLNSWTLMCSRWYSRGWTFQEHLLSTRRIVFHNDTIGWECKLASWHESQDLSHLLPHGIPPDIIETKEPEVVKQSSWPDMYRYSRLVSMYNRRDLSYPEDVLNAFRGTFSLLSQSFDGVNISGLPETFFNATLLWQPWTPMIRRRAKLQRKGDAVLPSWSWIGWCGDIHSESWALAYTYLRSHRGQPSTPQDLYNWQVDPTVEWHYSSRLDDEHYRILDTSQDYRQLSDKPERLEELGWTRWMHSSGSTVYRHHSVPTQRFWYPIPIPPTPRVRSGLVSARFLHGKTRVATFGLGERFYSEVCDCDSVDLLSPTCEYEEGSEIRDQWAGFLRLNRVRNSKVRFRGSATTTTCDLVELSAGSFVENINGVELFEESQRPARPKDRRIYEFYNVLCVRWKEQPDTLSRVGYRRALGRVQKDAWDAVAKPANVTLG